MEECPGPATAVFDRSLTAYDFGPSHPMSPIRVELTMRLAEELGVTGGQRLHAAQFLAACPRIECESVRQAAGSTRSPSLLSR